MQTPAEQVRDAVTETVDKTTEFDYWAFFLGTPLRIVVIVIVSIVVNLLVRKLINRFAQSIADGSTAASDRRRFAVSEGAAESSSQDPTARARRAQRAKTVGSMLQSIATIVISVIAFLMVLTELGFNLGPVLASAGIAGVAIGFGAQTLVKDYLSGFFIVVEDQYGIGDSVDLGEAVGIVEEVELRTTRVRGVDGTLWHVRNGEILRVGNQSQGWARAVMDIPLPYSSDRTTIDEVIADAVAAIRRDPKIAPVILEDPEIWGVEAITGESMTIRTVIKTEPNEQWAVARAFRAAIKHELDVRGLRMPLPQQTVLRTIPDPAHAVKESESEPGESDGDTGSDGSAKPVQ